MNSLPEEIIPSILALLPLVDAFRLRRVCHRFDRLLPAPTNLSLNEVEITFQLQERVISKREHKNVVGDILASYGESVSRLQLFFCSQSVEHENFILSLVVKCCPRVVEVEFQQLLPINNNLFSLSFSHLKALPCLKRLKARLSLEECAKSDADAFVGRLGEMEAVSSVVLRKYWFSYMDLDLPCVKEICFMNNWSIFGGQFLENNSYSQMFSNVDSIVFTNTEYIPAIGVFPENLRRLSLCRVAWDHGLPFVEMSAFKCLSNLSEISLYYVKLRGYQFLESCAKLESFSVYDGMPKFSHKTFFIAPDAPLRRVVFGPSVFDVSLLEVIQQRKYHLTSIRLHNGRDPIDFLILFSFFRNNAATLRSLQFASKTMDDECFHQFGDSNAFPVLSTLVVSACSSITVNGIRRLLEKRQARCEEGDEYGGSSGLREEGVGLPWRNPWAGGYELTLLCLVVNKKLLEECGCLEKLAIKAKVLLMSREGANYVV